MNKCCKLIQRISLWLEALFIESVLHLRRIDYFADRRVKTLEDFLGNARWSDNAVTKLFYTCSNCNT
jgi:hypothetical protein